MPLSLAHVVLRPEEPRDHEGIFNVHASAFPSSAEAQLVDALRDEGHARVSLVAEIDGRIVGHVLFSDLAIVSPSATVAALALAPLAVLPEFQRNGIGSELVRRGLEMCRADGYRIVIVLGEPSFYGRFGFSADRAVALESPFAGPYFLGLELVAGGMAGLAGRVEYPPPFSVF